MSNIQKKIKTILHCVDCDYTTCRKSQYTRHVLTSKHQYEIASKKCSKSSNSFHCSCGKKFKYESGYYRHYKVCPNKLNKTKTEKTKNADESGFSEKDLMIMVIEQNKELIKKNSELQTNIIEVLKNGTHNNHSHNKTFNIQVFLNETCKDAMNITDFVNSLNIQLSDLERIGDAGFATGISDIIVKELKLIDVNKRPLHCSDLKRETLYIRGEDKWEKEDTDKHVMQNMIQSVSHKNINMIPLWKEANPTFHDSTSNTSDRYNRIILGSLDNTKENNEKIMKTIAKEVKI